MAQQFVTNPVAPSAQDNLDLLYTNLAENVAYRRAKQQMKAAQKQDLELKMAQGLIPKANITVTDEGFAFEGEDTLGSELLGTERKNTSIQREAFWRAVGAPEPSEDMSRQGFTDVTEEQVPGQAAEFARITAAAKEAADNRLTPQEQELVSKDFAAASQMLGVVASEAGSGPQPTPQPQPQPSPTPSATPSPIPTPPSGSSIGSAVGGSGATTAVAPPPPPPPASLGAMMAGRLAKNAPVPATPAATPAGSTTPAGRTSTSQSESNSIKEMGQVEVGLERGGYEAQMANVAVKTTQVQSAQIDEIKRSIPRLAGLAALENYGNQLMQARGYNTGAPMQDTFSTLLNQRVKDIARWEEAATKSGVQQTLEKLDPFKVKVEGTKANLKVTRRNELGTRVAVNASTNLATGGKDDAGVYEYAAADDPNKLQSVEVTGDGKLRRDAAGIAYSKGPKQREHKDGAAFFSNLKQIAADEPIIKGWKVTSNDPSGKLPGVIKLVGPNNQEIAWVWNNKDGIWKLSASKDTEVGPLQLFTGTSFRRKGS